jgi:hypothetical protein
VTFSDALKAMGPASAAPAGTEGGLA